MLTRHPYREGSDARDRGRGVAVTPGHQHLIRGGRLHQRDDADSGELGVGHVGVHEPRGVPGRDEGHHLLVGLQAVMPPQRGDPVLGEEGDRAVVNDRRQGALGGRGRAGPGTVPAKPCSFRPPDRVR